MGGRAGTEEKAEGRLSPVVVSEFWISSEESSGSDEREKSDGFSVLPLMGSSLENLESWKVRLLKLNSIQEE
nr:hypothetical protein Itr_chr12CG21130 [Ipomoea trifida]